MRPGPPPRFFVFAFALPLCLLCAAPGGAETITVEYRFPAPSVERTKGYHRLRMAGLAGWGAPGAPVLPRRLARILLPAGASVESISVKPLGVSRLTGRYLLEPAAEEHSPSDRKPPRDPFPDAAIFGSAGPYPAEPWQNLGIGSKHGRSVLLLSLAPASWFPRSGEIVSASGMVVEVRTRPGAGAKAPPALPPRLERDLHDFVDNPPPRPARAARPPAVAPEEQVVYAIITTPALAAAFEPLASARTAGGLPARVFTTDWIAANYQGVRPDGGTDRPTAIRNFIIDQYQNHGLAYVLLGGDADGISTCPECGPEGVPVRYLTTGGVGAATIPSDLYYGCLDGSFDEDRDGAYGEPNDGVSGADVDLLFEVRVGRAPADTPEEAQNFVRKTLAYPETPGAVLREVLLVGERLGFGGDYDWGENLNEQIRLGSDQFISTVGFENSPYRDFFRVRTLSDRDHPEQNWPPRDLVEALEAGVHLVNHVGHADSSNVMKLTNAEIDGLSAATPFVGYTQSCYAGAFDNQRADGSYGPDSVVEHFLTGPGGAVAFIANSRRGWAGTGSADGPSQRFNRRFWDAVFRLGLLQLGAANDRSREENLELIRENPRARWCAYQLNLLGDPALTLKFATSRGSVSFDRDHYVIGETAVVTLIDSDLDLSQEEAERAPLNITAGSGAAVPLEAPETSVSSGVFQGRIRLVAGAAADGEIRVGAQDTITALYLDSDTGHGGSARSEDSAAATAPLEMAGGCPPEGSVGVPYAGRLAAGGGAPPYRFRAEEGYVEEEAGGGFRGLGARQGWTEDEGAWRYALPFAFPFYGRLHDSVLVSSNGYLELGAGDGLDFTNSPEELIRNARIAPLWADLVTTGGDIYIDERPESVTIRWRGIDYHNESDVSAEAELFVDGRIRFAYQAGNRELSPTIGISAGDSARFVLSSLNGRQDLSGAPPVTFFPTRLPAGLRVDPASGEIAGSPAEPGSGEVSFLVEDALGQEARSRCFLTIRPDGLALETPAEGSWWPRGGEETIRWHWFGNAGANVRLDLYYRPDGAPDDLHLPIADKVALGARAFRWILPQLEAPQARVRLQSLERPELYTWSGAFAIVGPTLRLLSPAGAERWVAGEEAVARWEAIGDAGARVSIRYNLDGSRESFPLVLAADAPQNGSYRLIVPATPSENCRLQVQSLTKPAVRGVSAAPFAIRLPSLELTFPNGGECLRAGETVEVTWSQAGNTGAEVVLEYNLDGRADRFPLLIGTFPNTRSAQWTVPGAPLPAARLRIRSPSNPALADVADGPFRLDTRCSLRALLWVPYIAVEEEQVLGVQDALRSREPDVSFVFSTTVTPGLLAQELRDRDVLLVPKQKQASGVDFVALGRTLAPALWEFLERGGAVVVCEQFLASEDFLPATGLLAAERLGEGLRLCEAAEPTHPLLAGVRPNFAGPRNTGWYQVGGAGAELLVQAGEGETVVAARRIGFGRIAFLGFDYFDWNEWTSRILANAARLPLPASGLRLVEPAAGSAFEAGTEVPVRWVTRGAADGPVLLSFNTTGSDSEFPGQIARVEGTAGRGTFRWAAPAPAASSYQLVRLKAQSENDPAHFDLTPGPFFLYHPLRHLTRSLPTATLGLPYREELAAEGGVPPYTFGAGGLPPGLILRALDPTRAEIAGTPQQACPNCQVELSVRDSLGLSATIVLPLPALLREIRLSRPTGGELWLYGSTQEVRWTVAGEVGPTVNLSFNTTGSTEEFPLLISASEPAGKPFQWQLPPLTASRCRLRVQSNEHPQIFSISRREFSISGPSLRLVAPAGGECWEPGKTKRILWESAGNDQGTVRIEYTSDGSAPAYPLIAEAPDTGEYLWTVPEVSGDDFRVRVSFRDVPEIESISGPFRIHAGCRLKGLVWSPCGSSGESEQVIREAIAGLEPDFEAETLVSGQPGPLEEALPNNDVLLVLLISRCSELDLEDLGRNVKPLLEAFVEEGGVVIFCAPQVPYSWRLLRGLGLVDTLASSPRAGTPLTVASLLHPVTREVPLEFTAPVATWAFSPMPAGFELLVGAAKLPVVASKEEGSGRWVILGFDFRSAEAASARLLANAVRFAPPGPGLRVLSPGEGEVLIAGQPVTVRWAAAGGRSGRVRISYNLDGSAVDFPLEIAEAPGGEEGGSFPWTVPPPPAGERFFTSRIQVRWVDPPELAARSREVFQVAREPLSIVTERLGDGHRGAPYLGEVRVAGGVPPYTFTASGLPPGLFLNAPAGSSPAAEVSGIPLATGTDQVVTVVARDFLGLEAERALAVNVLPSRIEVLAPSPGEFLLAGSLYPVRFRIDGYAGEALDLAFNLDGSSRLFPLSAGETPAGAVSFLWRVPEVAAAVPASRLRLSSRGLPDEVSAVSEPFAISPPVVACLWPNGGESLETDTLRTIRWRSLGNPSGRVRIEANLDGSETEYPLLIAEDAADTGRHPWPVPRTASETCRVRVRWAGEGGREDWSDGVFAIRYRSLLSGVVWIPFSSFDQVEVRGAIAASTLFENDFDWALSKAVTAADLSSALQGRDTFLVAQGETAGEVNFRALGRALGPVLREFVERGGTAVILKQVGRAREFLPATGLLEAEEIGSAFDVPVRVSLADHPVTNQVEAEFRSASSTAWYQLADEAAQVYAVTAEGRAVAAGLDLGDGRVVLIGFDYRDYTRSSARLLANALRNTRAVARPRFVRGDANASGTVDVSDALFILQYLFLGGRPPPCLDAADVNDNAAPGLPLPAIELNDAVHLLHWLFLEGSSPPPPAPVNVRDVRPSCGPDPQFRDDLDCSQYPPCGET